MVRPLKWRQQLQARLTTSKKILCWLILRLLLFRRIIRSKKASLASQIRQLPTKKECNRLSPRLNISHRMIHHPSPPDSPSLTNSLTSPHQPSHQISPPDSPSLTNSLTIPHQPSHQISPPNWQSVTTRVPILYQHIHHLSPPDSTNVGTKLTISRRLTTLIVRLSKCQHQISTQFTHQVKRWWVLWWPSILTYI